MAVLFLTLSPVPQCRLILSIPHNLGVVARPSIPAARGHRLRGDGDTVQDQLLFLRHPFPTGRPGRGCSRGLVSEPTSSLRLSVAIG